MENLTKAIDSLELEDLKTPVKEMGFHLIEPTEEEIKKIVEALVAGRTHEDIKCNIRRDGKGFSWEQIKEIDEARLAKIAELEKPVEEPVNP